MGDSLRNATGAIATGVVLVLAAAVVQFALIESLIPESGFRWSMTGLLSMLLLACLTGVAVVYAYSGGGLIDCWGVLLLPLFIAFTTVMSVAPTYGSPVPFWRWLSGPYLLQNIFTAIYGTLLWGGLGVVGFLLGMALNGVSRFRSNRSRANRIE